MTNQEMFDKAVRGLRKQDWKRSMDPSGRVCRYQNHEGLRCAWGHVDTELTNEKAGVYQLSHAGIGLAAKLNAEQLGFACALQSAHDDSAGGDSMILKMRRLASFWDLKTDAMDEANP